MVHGGSGQGSDDLQSSGIYDFRFICLISACVLYAFAGSPTPDRISGVEIIIGFLLVMSIGIAGGVKLLQVSPKNDFLKSAGQVYLIYGLIITSLVAGGRGAEFSAMVRDIIPFLFLFLPLFLTDLISRRRAYFQIFAGLVVLIGLIFSLRSLIMRYSDLCFLWCSGELLYLENMPSVLFSALILQGYSLKIIADNKFTVRSVFISFALMVISFLPIAAMAVTAQRASLGAVVVYLIFISLYYLMKTAVRAAMILSAYFMCSVFIGLSVQDVYDVLSEKNALVGLNMRPQEFAAVMGTTGEHPAVYLFGIGWGGHFYNPAVGGLSVNFTHNFFTNVLLKSGLCGLIPASLYILMLCGILFRMIMREPVVGLAVAAPVLIDLTLYASYKSPDFGLVLLLISSGLIYLKQSESLRFQTTNEITKNAPTEHIVHE